MRTPACEPKQKRKQKLKRNGTQKQKLPSETKRALSWFAAVLILLSSLIVPAFAESYNDDWVADYENMKKHVTPIYTVPTLFKNDAAFANNRRFPLVVQNNIEYVPLEMFSGLSGISVTANYSTTNFYITNSADNSYISFDAENDLVTSTGLQTYTLVTKLFYDTRYVPAKTVADVLGITVEVYNNPDDGVYALRFTDGKQKLTFAEVIKMYSPIKKTDTPIDNTENETPPPITPTEPEQPTAAPDIGRRTIYLSADVTQYEYLSSMLGTLTREGVDCAFFVSPQDILRYPDRIRQILTAGHELGLLLDPNDPETDYIEGRDNLYLVSKRTTHLVRFPNGSRSCPLSNEDYVSFVERYGLSVWDYNISVNDSSDMYEKLYTDLNELSSRYRTETAIVRLYVGRNGAATVRRYAALLEQKRQLTPRAIRESEEPIFYRRIT